MELHYVKLVVSFTLGRGISDPYQLFSCRSSFETAFRKSVPCRKSDCTGCPSARSCPCPAQFAQKISKDPEAVRRHQKPPLPFVFRFPVLAPATPGTTHHCSLTLFGSAIQEVKRFLTALELLLREIGASGIAVYAECPGGERTPVAGEGPLPILSPLDPAGSGPLPPDRVTVSFLTPLKLVHDGRLVKELTFSHLARALMRRVSSLAYAYEGAAPELDYRWLSQHSETVRTVSSDCRLVSWDGRPAGLMGSLSFRGDLEPFHLLLQSGVATQVGKGASFGFGAYRLS